jgi:hypothetical protein
MTWNLFPHDPAWPEKDSAHPTKHGPILARLRWEFLHHKQIQHPCVKSNLTVCVLTWSEEQQQHSQRQRQHQHQRQVMDHTPIRIVVPGVLNFFFEQGRAILLCLANNWDPNSEVHSQLHWLERIEFQFVDNGVGVEAGRPDLWPVGHSLCPSFAFMHHDWFHVLNAHVKFDAANCGRSVHVGPGCAKIANDDVVMETWSVLPALILENSMKKLKAAVCTEEKEFTITVEDKRVSHLHPEHASGWDMNDEHVLHNVFKVWKKEGKGQDPWLSTLKVCAWKSSQAFFDHIDSLRFSSLALSCTHQLMICKPSDLGGSVTPSGSMKASTRSP